MTTEQVMIINMITPSVISRIARARYELRLNKYRSVILRIAGKTVVIILMYFIFDRARPFENLRPSGRQVCNSVFNIRARLVGNIFRIRTRKTNRKLYIRAECIRDFRRCCRYTHSTVIVLTTPTSTSWFFFIETIFFNK